MATNYRCRKCGTCFEDPDKVVKASPYGSTATFHCPACGSMDLEEVKPYMAIDLNDDNEEYLLIRRDHDDTYCYLHSDAKTMLHFMANAVRSVTASTAREVGVSLARIAVSRIVHDALDSGLKLAKEREPDA